MCSSKKLTKKFPTVQDYSDSRDIRSHGIYAHERALSSKVRTHECVAH